MKKIILGILAITTLSLTSCKKETKVEEAANATSDAMNTAADQTADAANSAVNAAANASTTAADVVKAEIDKAMSSLPAAPTFDNAEATALVASIQTAAANTKAYASIGDKANLATAQSDFSKLAAQMTQVMSKLKPEQQKQLTEWYGKVSQALTAK